MNGGVGRAALEPGDSAPVFAAPGPGDPHFFFGQAAGAYVVLSFVASGANPDVREMLDAARAHEMFDGRFARFIVVSADRSDASRLNDASPGFRILWDFENRVAKLCGVGQLDAANDGNARISIIFDRRLRVLGTVPLVDPQRHIGEVERFLAKLPRESARGEGGHSAPVLIVPRVFEPQLCRDLISHCSSRQGEDSGFMSTDPGTGNTIFKRDHNFKRRTDFALEDETLRLAIHGKVLRRLLPEIDKAFQFHVTRIERYLIARYDAREGGYFRPHRDNGTRATAHRRFAVTVNLNAEDYDGGDLRFPEFDTMTFRAPTGGAAIFSCSLMHEVMPVTRGTRYCFLPFLYDEVSAKVREDNLKYLTSAEKREINI